FARFAMPALPALAVEASLLLDSLIAIQPLVGLTAALLASLPTLSETVRFDALLQQTDTRTLARAWVDVNLPPAATISVDAPPPFVYDQIYAPFNALDRLERPGPTVTVYRLTR